MWRQRRLHISIHAHTRPMCRQPPNRWLAVVLWRRNPAAATPATLAALAGTAGGRSAAGEPA